MSPLGTNFGTPIEKKKQNPPLLREVRDLLIKIETSGLLNTNDPYRYRNDRAAEEIKNHIGDLQGEIEQVLTPSSAFVSKAKWDCLFCSSSLELSQTNIDLPNTDKTCSSCGTAYVIIWREKKVKVK